MVSHGSFFTGGSDGGVRRREVEANGNKNKLVWKGHENFLLSYLEIVPDVPVKY